jgi:hypothetical protein
MKYENEEVLARLQAAAIRRYWQDEGFNVTAWVERVEGTGRHKTGYWAIRSDLIAGHPHPNKRIEK